MFIVLPMRVKSARERSSVISTPVVYFIFCRRVTATRFVMVYTPIIKNRVPLVAEGYISEHPVLLLM
jgi:hypothetical protein